MQFYVGSKDGLADFLLTYPEEEVALPSNVYITEEEADALDRDLSIRDLGQPVVTNYPDGTTVVLNQKDVREILSPRIAPAEGSEGESEEEPNEAPEDTPVEEPSA